MKMEIKDKHDYTRFISAIREHFPDTVYFLCWSGRFGLDQHANAKALLEDPWVINRQELGKMIGRFGTS